MNKIKEALKYLGSLAVSLFFLWLFAAVIWDWSRGDQGSNDYLITKDEVQAGVDYIKDAYESMTGDVDHNRNPLAMNIQPGIYYKEYKRATWFMEIHPDGTFRLLNAVPSNAYADAVAVIELKLDVNEVGELFINEKDVINNNTETAISEFETPAVYIGAVGKGGANHVSLFMSEPLINVFDEYLRRVCIETGNTYYGIVGGLYFEDYNCTFWDFINSDRSIWSYLRALPTK